MDSDSRLEVSERLQTIVDDAIGSTDSGSSELAFAYRLLQEKRRDISLQNSRLDDLAREKTELASSAVVAEERFLVKNRLRQLLGWELVNE